MTEQRRPQSRMVPALTAALVGVLLGALVVVVGVLAGQRGGCCCCCQSYGPACVGISGLPDGGRPTLPGRPFAPWHTPIVPPWVRPELQRHDVPEPGTLMLVGLGALMVGRMAA